MSSDIGDERSPLLGHIVSTVPADSLHIQFCNLVGIPSSTIPHDRRKNYGEATLYERAKRKCQGVRCTYSFMATLSNTLLLSQVVLGAALTALGASASSHILIAIFGALNTVIAGLVAYLKSRGQPQRSKMFKDDLESVIAEIENTEIMWLGISRGVHGAYSSKSTSARGVNMTM